MIFSGAAVPGVSANAMTAFKLISETIMGNPAEFLLTREQSMTRFPSDRGTFGEGPVFSWIKGLIRGGNQPIGTFWHARTKRVIRSGLGKRSDKNSPNSKRGNRADRVDASENSWRIFPFALKACTTQNFWIAAHTIRCQDRPFGWEFCPLLSASFQLNGRLVPLHVLPRILLAIVCALAPLRKLGFARVSPRSEVSGSEGHRNTGRSKSRVCAVSASRTSTRSAS
jgi:hypothetical protein